MIAYVLENGEAAGVVRDRSNGEVAWPVGTGQYTAVDRKAGDGVEHGRRGDIHRALETGEYIGERVHAIGRH